MAGGYGETAPYGENQYKGEEEVSVVEPPHKEQAVSLLIEQYSKEYTNG